jgi:hypothetical protein
LIGFVVVVQGCELAATDHEPIAQLIGQEGIRLCRDNRNLVVVDGFDGFDIAGAVADHRKLLGVKLRRLVVGDAVEVPDHVLGFEVTPIVPFHPLLQLELPAPVVIGIDCP